MNLVQQRTKAVKEFIRSRGNVDLVGIADPALYVQHDRFHTPEEVLPGAKSIIVFGRRFADGAVQGAMRRFEDDNELALGSYAAYAATMTPGFLMLFDTFYIMQHLERAFGYIAEPISLAPMQGGKPNNEALPLFCGPYKQGQPIDIDQCAVMAGLGQYGWSGRILTPEYGPRVMFGALVTQMELEFDAPYEGPALCKGEECQACAKLCPNAGILTMDQVDEPLMRGCKDHMVPTSPFSLNRCLVANCAMRAEFDPLGKGVDYVASNDPSDEELAAAFADRDPVNSYLDHYPKLYCEKCLLYCQSGDWDERFRARGLSMGPEALLAKEAK